MPGRTPNPNPDRSWLELNKQDRRRWAATEDALAAVDYWQAASGKPEFVYFIRAWSLVDEDDYDWAETGPVKIGVARDPIQRLAELQCGNPLQLRIQQVILGNREVEQAYHKHWHDARIRGEWFGNGAEEVIVALAREASRRQIEAHRNNPDDPDAVGASLHHLAWEAAGSTSWWEAA